MVTQAQSELVINHDLFYFLIRERKKIKIFVKRMLQKHTCMHHDQVQEKKNLHITSRFLEQRIVNLFVDLLLQMT